MSADHLTDVYLSGTIEGTEKKNYYRLPPPVLRLRNLAYRVGAAAVAAIDKATGYVYSSDPEEDEDKDNSSTLVSGDAE
ncbi:hypothetical protein AC578_9945 [Pseudocercospora eumusae]|uniref:Uncharacterized protein n=1 Tax=Pseudocercospora eumusae TaxID=321146 RepID=A0A139GU83_9PEZI|nr:hypothetical protein AC578_9945 [Pseudocercospora eumusae]